jgi:hypothetical protein
MQLIQDRFQECIGCYICAEVYALLTDYDAFLLKAGLRIRKPLSARWRNNATLGAAAREVKLIFLDLVD